MANHNTTKTPESLDQWIGLDVYGSSGEKIGEVSDIYIDDATNRPQWLTIEGGWFGMNHHFAPIEGAEYRSGNLHVPFTKEQIKDAPSVDADNDHLDPGEETRLYTHYKLERSTAKPPHADTDTDTARTHAAVVRTEEQPKVDTNTRDAGTVTLRRYVVTDDVDLSAPVRKEFEEGRQGRK